MPFLPGPSRKRIITVRKDGPSSLRIGIAYNLKTGVQPENSSAEDAWEEFDSPETIQAIREVLVEEGHEAFPLGAGLSVMEKIREWEIDFVFNIAEGFRGRSREAHIPALLEMMKIPYSGSDPLALALTLDKALTKRIALSLGIPTPNFWILNEPAEADKIPGWFPLFVKPLWQGSSKGIRHSSRVNDRKSLRSEVSRLFENYGREPILVEEYITGREFTVGILGNKDPEVLGVMEIAYQDSLRRDFCYSLEVKRNWKAEVHYHVPPRIEEPLEKEVSRAALRLFETVGLRDVARLDFRLDPNGRFYFLEANPLPGLSPESGDLVILAQKKGWSYEELILKITRHAFSRYPELNVRLNVE